MNFQDITALVSPFFLDHKFSIVENSSDYIRYEYENLGIYISHDWRDNSISVFISRNREHIAELTDEILRDFFKDETRLRNNDSFAADLINFLSGKGKALLENDFTTIARLRSCTHQSARTYTADLLKRQYLRAADIAWEMKNYAAFIEQLNKIPEGSLSKTYQMKYQYALKKKGQ
jgi:hypothetical protein